RGVLPGADDIVATLEIGEGPVRLRLVDRTEILLLVLLHLEADLILQGGLGIGVDGPEFLGDEGADLPLPFDDEAHRHRLDAAGGKAPGDLFPQQGRDHETHHAVEEAPGLDRKSTRLNSSHVNISYA